MKYEHEELIDLGTASVETQGGSQGTDDVSGLFQPAGISDE